MLHAFNQKGARRVLASSGTEHTNSMNEDAITSMVFSPLLFMPTASAFAIMAALVGPALSTAASDRAPSRHELRFWPSGLRARRPEDDRLTRCEPDFTLRFDFPTGTPVVVIGEMKWDWRMSAGDLRLEVTREREAVAAEAPDADLLPLVITKFPLNGRLQGVTQRTWVQVHRVASDLARSTHDTPHRRWGGIVEDFLDKAEQTTFQGFDPAQFDHVTRERPVFWRQPNA